MGIQQHKKAIHKFNFKGFMVSKKISALMLNLKRDLLFLYEKKTNLVEICCYKLQLNSMKLHYGDLSEKSQPYFNFFNIPLIMS